MQYQTEKSIVLDCILMQGVEDSYLVLKLKFESDLFIYLQNSSLTKILIQHIIMQLF